MDQSKLNAVYSSLAMKQRYGFGVQGHNCGYRHRSCWRWMHAYFPEPAGATTLEALGQRLEIQGCAVLEMGGT